MPKSCFKTSSLRGISFSLRSSLESSGASRVKVVYKDGTWTALALLPFETFSVLSFALTRGVTTFETNFNSQLESN